MVLKYVKRGGPAARAQAGAGPMDVMMNVNMAAPDEAFTRLMEARLTGEAPKTIRHFMEIRGIGIIDIKAMFGVGAVAITKSIDLVIHLENWDEKKTIKI